MTVRVGINGFGRIGRNFFRAVEALRAAGNTDIEIVCVNDLTTNDALAHLLKYDSVLGRLGEDVTYDDNSLTIGDRKIGALAVKEGPAAVPWGDYGVDVVVVDLEVEELAELVQGESGGDAVGAGGDFDDLGQLGVVLVGEQATSRADDDGVHEQSQFIDNTAGQQLPGEGDAAREDDVLAVACLEFRDFRVELFTAAQDGRSVPVGVDDTAGDDVLLDVVEVVGDSRLVVDLPGPEAAHFFEGGASDQEAV